jgi:hypothetical protein
MLSIVPSYFWQTKRAVRKAGKILKRDALFIEGACSSLTDQELISKAEPEAGE